jgi:ketosteroid isomerase-like protein
LSEHPQVARTREFLDRFARGELESLGEFFSEDVVWHVAGTHPLSGDYVGRDALVAYFLRANDESGGTLTLEPSGILANDRHVAIFLRATGERDGRTLDIEMAETMNVGPDGLWTRFAAMPDDQASVDAFWS